MRGTEVIGDGVPADTRDIGAGLGIGNAVLDVEALDLRERTCGGAIVGDELGDDGEGTGRVQGHAFAEESRVTHPVGIKVTSISIADTGVMGAVIASACRLFVHGARVRSKSVGHGVCFPDIHLRAARSNVSRPGVRTAGFCGPAFAVGSSVDELQILWALSITVSRSILGTGQVGGVLGHSSVGVHGHEVESAVQSARKVGDIHIERELLTQKLELLVGSL